MTYQNSDTLLDVQLHWYASDGRWKSRWQASVVSCIWITLSRQCLVTVMIHNAIQICIST